VYSGVPQPIIMVRLTHIVVGKRRGKGEGEEERGGGGGSRIVVVCLGRLVIDIQLIVVLLGSFGIQAELSLRPT